MRSSSPAFICICLVLALCCIPVLAYDCGCDSGWDDENDGGTSGGGGDQEGAESGDDDSSSDSWDVTDSSWYSDMSGGDDSDTGESGESSDSSDYSGDSESSGTTVADGSAEDAQVWYLRAREYYDEGLYNESMAAFNTSLSMDPYNKRTWMRKGELLMELGYYPAAGEAFQQVIKLDPAEYEAYLLTGEAFFHMGMFGDSIVMYDKALAVNPLFESAEYQKRLAQEAMAETSAELEIGEGRSPGTIDEEPEVMVETPASTANQGKDKEPRTTASRAAGMMPHHILLAVCIFSILAIHSLKKR